MHSTLIQSLTTVSCFHAPCIFDAADELRYAISMLNSLIKNGYEHQMDCMYGCAVAHYLLGEYDKSRSECEAILRTYPENNAVADLHVASFAAMDEDDEKKAKTIAVGGTVAMAALGLALMFGAGAKRR